MIRLALGALAGALLLHRLPALPVWPWAFGALCLALVAARLHSPLFTGLAAAFFWSHLVVCWTAPAPLPVGATAADIEIEGVIAGLPERQGDRVRFVLDVEALQLPGGERQSGDWRVRLGWYRAPPGIRPDQRWRLAVRLRPAHGHVNPGGFDYERWLFRHGIVATGYVRPDGGRVLDEQAGRHRLTAVRDRLSTRLAALLGPGPASGVLRALVLGDRGGIDRPLWDLFRHTGTSHLMAISGLHIGLVAGLVAWLTSTVWRRIPALCRRWPAVLAGAVAGWSAALLYAALAGFSLPTQRALVMLTTGLLLLAWRRPVASGQLLAAALLAVLAWDPQAVGDPGFWLSFGAVAVILLAVLAHRSRRDGESPARRVPGAWIRVQFALTLALAPALLAFGLPVPLVGLPANLLMVPLFTFLLVPLALLGSLGFASGLDPGGWLLQGAAAVVDSLLPVLEWAAGNSDWLIQLPEPEPLALMSAVAGVAVLLLPRGTPGRLAGLALLLPLLHGPAPRSLLQPGDFRLTVLDVGQGLSAVIETRNRVLVFDAGPAYRSGFETGSAIVAPFLRHQGWRGIDRLVLSHADRDHAGGASGLLSQLPVEGILAGEPSEHPGLKSTPCDQRQQWDWDGVAFRILYPDTDILAGPAPTGNNASCVLRVENAAGAVLLTGDIEASVEARLVATQPDRLAATVVVAPHHGSRTSSTSAFVAATAPDYVLYTAGFRNRYGFPAPEVAARWRATGAVALDTSKTGAVTFEFQGTAGLEGPRQARQEARRYWHFRAAD